jgi:hypothetical protein
MEYLITTELSRALRVQLQEINHATHGNYPGPQSSSSSDHPENTNPPKTDSFSPGPLLFCLRGPGPLFDLGKKKLEHPLIV